MKNRQIGMSMWLHNQYNKELSDKITLEGRKNLSDVQEYLKCMDDPLYFFKKYCKIIKEEDFETQNYEEWDEE